METPARHSPSLDSDHLPQGQSLRRSGVETITSYNPATQLAIGEVMRTPTGHAAEVMERAGEAQRAWRRRPLAQRVAAVREVLYGLMVWRDDLLELGVEELGMTPLEAQLGRA